MPHARHLIEYAALRVTAAGFCLLPHRVALAAVWPLAWTAFHVLRYRRARTRARLHAVFGSHLAHREATRIAWVALRNLVFTVAETMRASRLSAEWFHRHVQNHDAAVAQVKSLLAQHGGLVLAVPHMGNWDLAGVLCQRSGIPLCVIAGRQRNPLIGPWLNRLRGPGMEVYERGTSAVRQVARRLHEGRAFAVLPDVRMRRPDLTVSFLGGQANLGRGMAVFARGAHVPILPVVLTRVGWFDHRIETLPIVPPDPARDKEADIQRMTTTVLGLFDTAIRRDPGQWFWYNSRWVLDPLTDGKPS